MSNPSPLVSIVTPSFNSAQFIESAIESVRNQDYPAIEHLIIDGGSTDGTLEILKNWPAVRWVSEPDEGQADAINKGFRLARGEIIGWLNADDTYEPGAISAAVDYLQRHPNVDLVYGGINLIDQRGTVLYRRRAQPFHLHRMLFEAAIPQAGMFFRRYVVDQMGGINPDLHYVLDWEFTFRIARRYNIAHVQKIWGNFRIVTGTKSVQQPEKFWPEIIPILENAIREEPERLQPWSAGAMCTAWLVAGAEYCRAGQLAEAQNAVERAFEHCAAIDRHPSVMAVGLYRQAVYPWHNAFQEYPHSAAVLDNLSGCLTGSPNRKQVLGYLYLYRAARSARRQNGESFWSYLEQAKRMLGIPKILSWPSVRIILSAWLKP
ncbi:MAG: glycosyltransferase [Chloroflexi bacterium]|nr:MAG: glycosyltransferase [Chloroflexota bacterium]